MMKKQLTVSILFSLISTMANAHPGHGLAGGELESMYAGFMHPLTGWDHLLVMLAIGFWAAKLGGKARWQLPLTFMLVMALGAILGSVGFAFSGLETAIAASVMAMGLLLVMSLPLNTAARLAITALFALMHGLAHGAELTLQQGFGALGGMLLATGLLHCAGLLIGSQRLQVSQWLQASFAWGMMLVGGYLLLAS